MNTQTLKELKRTPNPASAISNQSAVVALISAGAVIILLILLHFLKDDVNPNWQPISEYALGKYGWIVTLAFLSLSVACFALFWTLRSQTKTIIGKIGLDCYLLLH